ncbi:hypothetical protein BKA82DRAFT_29322 [Pisolithus tinctorius]|nr:hypothetical protein BKA82DRAFT_29322 [Pisolithus tinctorius]
MASMSDDGNSITFDCPGCQAIFPSPAALLNHLKTEGGTCTDAIPVQHIPVPPAFQRGFEENDVMGHYYPTSGYIYNRGDTFLDRMKASEHERRRQNQLYYPFADEGEWELAKFLALNFTQSQMNQFLKLKWFETRVKPSFKSADQLLGWMASLPHGPQWRRTTVEFKGYKSIHPIQLIWQDALEVVKDLFSNPIFANFMTYDPHMVFRGPEREYSEFFTATCAFDIQVQLPQGATIVPIIIASDKTPVTRHTGGLEMHPVFITIGNIQSDVRMQASSHAWHCIAFMPVPVFEVHPDFQTILTSRLFHRCMDIVFASLKTVTSDVAYIADLPEQQLVTCVAKNASPITTAVLSDFGDSVPQNPRTGSYTLQQIVDLCTHTQAWNIPSFQKAAKAEKLLGVHHPFWRDWKFADPAHFLVGEILHTCHKFFFDHVLKWSKEAAGDHLLDTQYKIQHKRVGVRHFASGVSHVKQMMGRDHRDIERTIVPMLDGAVPPLFVYAVRSMVEFIYRAQQPIHTHSSIASMTAALQAFHATKHAILDVGARRGAKGSMDNFNIPKLELMHTFACHIKENGALIQYTADVTERLLITHCKTPFEQTNRRSNTFVDQVVELLNREETIRSFDLYILLCSSDLALDTAIMVENEEVTGVDPALSFINRVLPEKETTFRGPRPFRNHFNDPKCFSSSSGAFAFHVTVLPDRATLMVSEMQVTYKLPDLPQVISDYISAASCGCPTEHWDAHGMISLWNKFRIQLHSSFQTRYICRSQVVQAFPPSDSHPLGNCDAVLLKRVNDNVNFDVAQVRAIFTPKTKKELPVYLGPVPLIYVRYFRVVWLPEQNPGVGLYRVQHIPPSSAGASGIVPLTNVIHAVELVPVYNTVLLGVDACSETCMEAYDQYYLNTFADKETYHILAE